ncbi:hypothetical protein [Mucilaginibacter sp. FT3.2]|uniref:hypothetical protein n=1 Tax=Mucilaginibacter sp. FT3.2 TaxID=2723090 RepID=UPI00161F1FA9|nr:hypothetical protein [Mucilaginibacter sp. FT3.2]MBB6230836.1 hypothetical protein [Mucilaginibacter sp. FT3.2]
MKPIIKYISLLLFSGLIIPVCTLSPGFTSPTPVKLNNSTATQIKHDNGRTLSHIIIADIARNIFPALKSLNSL